MYTANDLHGILIMGDNDLNDNLGAYPAFTVLSGGEPWTEPREEFGVFEAEITEADKGPEGETTKFRVTIERLDD